MFYQTMMFQGEIRFLLQLGRKEPTALLLVAFGVYNFSYNRFSQTRLLLIFQMWPVSLDPVL